MRNTQLTYKKRTHGIIPYLFVSPFIISFLVFFLYPTISTIVMSFQRILGPGDVSFIGLRNYQNLLNPLFFTALKNTTIYTFWTILVLVPLPIILAVILNDKTTIGKNVFRSIFFMPALTSVIVAGIFFRYAFGEQETTFINAILGNLGVKPIVWLQQKSTGMFALVVLCTWRWLGVNIIYFLSGLQNIPAELYESADIDGANAINKFINITLPGLRPVIIYVITISVYGGYAMFAESYTYWGTSNPGGIGLTLVQYIYQTGFNQNDMGFASAIGITLLLIVMIVNVIQLSFFGYFRKEED
ncbi:MAG: sugar ABC transporter permease [Clostridiales bacterium]|nr:sugar ABC transporter permease [Clostridiales bacterium]